MITASEIKKKAERIYISFLQMIVSGKPFERIVIPCDKKPSKDLAEYEKEMRDIRSLSKEVKGFGYTIAWQTVNKKSLGSQDIPYDISFEIEADFLKFLKKENEVEQFRNNVSLILSDFPQLKEWIEKHPQKVIDNASQWSDLLKVLAYFRNNPQPHLYIRELPIAVHTKFIENNKGVLTELLDIIIPDYINQDEETFEKRFNLNYDEPVVRLRLLDKILSDRYFFGIDDLAIPVSLLRTLEFAVKNVFVVENKGNFLTFPKITDSILIWGKGYAVADLKEVALLRNSKLYYWGDLDAQGFEILSQFRGYFPQTQSLLMDAPAFDKFFENDQGKESKVSVELNLTEPENTLYQKIKQNNWRLEQEKIPQNYVEDKIKKAI